MSKRPTNHWFQNLIVETGRQPVDVLPYYVKVQTTGLDVCLPVLDTSSFSTAIIAPFVQNMALRSTSATTSQKVTGYTDLGCTVVWAAAGGSMTANLVRGAAYVTMTYATLTPVVNTLHAFTNINGAGVAGSGSFTGTKFRCTLNNGQVWIIYASSSVTFTLSGQTLTAGGSFTGTIRVAVLPADSGAETVLDGGAGMIPTGGTVTMAVSGSTYTKTLTWAATGSGNLLTYAKPHHQDRFVSPVYSGLTLTTLRGSMRAVTGTTWTLTMTVPTVGWNNAGAIASSRVAAVQAALDAEQGFVPTVNDPYFGGKSMAKAARLVLIAAQLGDTVARDQLLGNLRTVLTNYLTGALATKLRYDTVWGGIVSQAGLTDPNVDFGNGRYNDHYFHWGYTIYAAAVVARYDAAWASYYRSHINDLVRDIANPASDDPYFVRFRHFDHYEGHSWAAGLFEFDANRNQESTSEAVNAWYAVALWGLATGQTATEQTGRALLTEEILTAQKYRQIRQAETVYPQPFRAKGAIGILWGGKVDYATWFGAEVEKIHGIQMLPITPASDALFNWTWVSETWTATLGPAYNGMIETWKSVVLGAYAKVNPADAWTRAQALTAYDDGLSKTALLYHIACQPDLNTYTDSY